MRAFAAFRPLDRIKTTTLAVAVVGAVFIAAFFVDAFIVAPLFVASFFVAAFFGAAFFGAACFGAFFGTAFSSGVRKGSTTKDIGMIGLPMKIGMRGVLGSVAT